MNKIEELEAKTRAVVDRVMALKKENQQLRNEYDSLKAHLALLSNENTKAQQILADYEQLKRKQDQVAHRVERALHSLDTLRPA